MSGEQTAFRTATIANGASLSGIVNCGGLDVVGIQMPTGWTAASISFQVSHDGVTFQDVYDDAGAEVTITAAASRYLSLVTALKRLGGVRFLKVRSGATGAAVNQGAERTIRIVLAGRG